MSHDSKSNDEKNPATETKKQPLPAIESEQVTDSDLDEVAGGMAAWCTVTGCGANK